MLDDVGQMSSYSLEHSFLPPWFPLFSLRLEYDSIWFALSLRAWRGREHPPPGPAVPGTPLVVSVGHRFYSCSGHVIHGLGAAVLRIHVHAKHIQKIFEEAGKCT